MRLELYIWQIDIDDVLKLTIGGNVLLLSLKIDSSPPHFNTAHSSENRPSGASATRMPHYHRREVGNPTVFNRRIPKWLVLVQVTAKVSAAFVSHAPLMR
jgi:hypothetical protein